MHSYEFEYGLDTVARINKTKARNLYDAGKLIIIYMIYDNPESPYNCGFPIKKDLGILKDRAFDAWVNEYEYYNSGNSRGSYAKFFAKTADLKKEKKNEKN